MEIFILAGIIVAVYWRLRAKAIDDYRRELAGLPTRRAGPPTLPIAGGYEPDPSPQSMLSWSVVEELDAEAQRGEITYQYQYNERKRRREETRQKHLDEIRRLHDMKRRGVPGDATDHSGKPMACYRSDCREQGASVVPVPFSYGDSLLCVDHALQHFETLYPDETQKPKLPTRAATPTSDAPRVRDYTVRDFLKDQMS